MTKLFAALTALFCAVALAGPAAAQSKDNLRKLSEAYKLIQSDETAKAVEQLNALLEEAPEDSGTAAKAMLLRGQAYAKAGRHAQALSDFNAALWLQGLNASQRKDAVAARQAALGKLGLAEEEAAPTTADASAPSQTASIPTSIPTSTEDEETTASGTSQPARTQEPSNTPPTTAWQTEVETAESEREESDSIGSFFSNLFGGSEEPEPASQRETETAAASGWTASTTDVTASTSSASGDGPQYRVQLASVGTRDGAESEVRRLSRLLGDALQGETPSILRTDTDAGNTYYRIIVGPQPSRDAASNMCQTFKSRGVDCLVVSSR
ncbi:SPOR domain-containing protein [Dichotomicrobium thermohalophilum]|uniref:SPOR domain-containing protein n=1 Tax=Dichotomicrobium thermohalophilum TaxID=933063 RepID=UPI0011C23981|nr:SPOR domain-containing protein [Dichotomicrobium thermohalophilum]